MLDAYPLSNINSSKFGDYMGIIIRQGIKTSIVRYMAALIGVIATLFIYPLRIEAKGEIDSILAFALLLVPFAVFGGHSLIIRFFPLFKDSDENENGFFWLVLVYELIALTVFSGLFLCFLEDLVQLLVKKMPNASLLLTYKYHIVALTWMLAGTGFLNQFISNYQRTTVPTLISWMIPKIVLPSLILMVLFGWLDIKGMVGLFIVSNAFIVTGLFIYLFFLKKKKLWPNLAIWDRIDIREFGIYAFYGMLGSIGGVIAFHIDIVMVSMFTSSKITGIFTISAFIASAIHIPSHSLIAISAPILSEHMKKDEFAQVNILYKKTSLNLLIAGLTLFTCIWSSIHDLFHLTGKYELLLPGLYVVLWVGLARLWDMATSINGNIISYSKYFRYNFYVLALLALMNIYLNVILIPLYGIVGAAFATFLSLSVFNLVKLIIVWIKFSIHPFSPYSFYLLLLGLSSFAIASLIPESGYPLLNIFIKSILILIIMGTPIYYFRFSEDLNRTIGHLINRVKGFL